MSHYNCYATTRDEGDYGDDDNDDDNNYYYWESQLVRGDLC